VEYSLVGTMLEGTASLFFAGTMYHPYDDHYFVTTTSQVVASFGPAH
jgi:hypothetical protein